MELSLPPSVQESVVEYPLGDELQEEPEDELKGLCLELERRQKDHH